MKTLNKSQKIVRHLANQRMMLVKRTKKNKKRKNRQGQE